MNHKSILASCIVATCLFVVPPNSMAADEIKGKRIQSTSTVKTINPKALKNIKAVGKVKMLSDVEYRKKIKAHNLKMKSQAVGIKQQARTNISFQSQNNDFKGEYDCDDGERGVNPDAQEVCDGIDNNCDGDVDHVNGRRLTSTYYLDADLDLWGDASKAYYACELPDGYSERRGDCNDKVASIHPGAEDTPQNGIDENCDGSK